MLRPGCTVAQGQTVTSCEWFTKSPSMPSKHGIKMAAPLEVSTKDKQHALVCFVWSEGRKGAEIR